MNIQQTAKMTGVPVEILIKMRSRDTTSMLSGPPYTKTLGKGGETLYVYNAAEVRKWLKIKLCQVTAGDAANIMGVSRDDIVAIHGIKAFKISGEYDGRLIVNNTNRIYIWLPAKNNRKKLSI